ncbi:hypothetical protein CXF83_14575 [Shewanella sp. Choline-02u-19]|jgi:hypothetical protein|uniref:hypothetical protein n=1 Tax=unclassified Shewanella TaxID=196818 RepID=UPI000C328C61|nr:MULTISPECIES: hypothetical protein [unclassified Shewanella]PKG56190.1 hypothetical protein CXF82_16050 [Shewanella sp. GutDb-MelDb]PKG72575.1 hypothetical protein CXF86_21815 [Shewanella sp. GutCb]PKH57048.1 hypothetical protein CXF84_11285 [Shewanella sp. Bg11-22]PKI27845.1 hypothetical protein CXF83_14575 [Shewanella sp. Choline-02u-19]
MDTNQVTNEQDPIDCDNDIEMLSQLNRKRLKLFGLMIGIVAGLPAGFYSARWVYQWLFPVG